MNHIEFGELESALACGSDTDRAWEAWIDQTEQLANHNCDGCGEENGYSLDEAYDCWRSGVSAPAYVDMVKARPNYTPRGD